MNRYRSGGPSKATPTTLCQKCLKKGHYTYECSASQQDRPYISRPSRSQQLSNPKLAPKLSSVLPPMDAKPAAKAEAKNRDATTGDSTVRRWSAKDVDGNVDVRRRRSVSSYSSDSVSSYSTNRSRSRSRTPARRSESPERRRERSVDTSSSPAHVRRDRSPRSEGRRSRMSKALIPDHQNSRDTPRETAARDRSRSPVQRTDGRDAHYRRRSRSRSPFRGVNARGRPTVNQSRAPPRERSLSPFSKRLALTKAMSG